ncbi:hypothetical protein [Nocardia sp. NPDC052566]|uniref:hypothetical protein n=1 Tax=Nocardia sp. NPDC052566 TaxID=3364330 RepID=UPI0037C67A2E
MFETCHTPHEIAHLLRHHYGLPVQLLGGRPVLTTGSLIGAVVMPAELGRKVLATLDHKHAAPVVADPSERTWTFLVNPPTPAIAVDVAVRRCLAGHHVTIVPSGRQLMLPATDSSLGWHWAGESAPGTVRMPPRAAVIAAVHRVTSLEATIP